MANTVNAGNGQTVADVALQEYGGMESLFGFAQANQKSLTDDLLAAESIALPIGLITNETVITALASSNIQPATATQETMPNPNPPSGIGYWTIGKDFKVS